MSRKKVDGKQPSGTVQISAYLQIRVTPEKLIFISQSPDSDEPENTFSIDAEDGMEVAKFIVLLLPIGQRLKVAAALTTSVSNAIG